MEHMAHKSPSLTGTLWIHPPSGTILKVARDPKDGEYVDILHYDSMGNARHESVRRGFLVTCCKRHFEAPRRKVTKMFENEDECE